jgi:hypothetical protein
VTGVQTCCSSDLNTLVESHSPRELEEFRDSNFSKSIEREIEDEKLTSSKSNTKRSCTIYLKRNYK